MISKTTLLQNESGAVLDWVMSNLRERHCMNSLNSFLHVFSHSGQQSKPIGSSSLYPWRFLLQWLMEVIQLWSYLLQFNEEHKINLFLSVLKNGFDLISHFQVCANSREWTLNHCTCISNRNSYTKRQISSSHWKVLQQVSTSSCPISWCSGIDSQHECYRHLTTGQHTRELSQLLGDQKTVITEWTQSKMVVWDVWY